MTADDTPGEAAAGSVRAVERAIDILFCFVEHGAELDIAALQRHTGLSRPTLYRLLATLEGKQLVYSFGSPRRFQLGHRFGRLVDGSGRNPALVAVAHEGLQQLWRQTQETVALMVPISRTHRLCVVELKSQQPISFSRGTGYTEPLYRGASGKVLLAHMAEDRVAEAVAPLPKKQRERLLGELPTIRLQRYWVTHGEVIPGTVALASPVLDRRGEPLGAVCVFGTESRLRGAALADCARAAQEAAAQIARVLHGG